MPFKMRYKNLEEVVDQLNNASKMHKKQAEVVQKHINSMESDSPVNKGTKGGGTKKVCLPLAKIRSMSKAERQAVIRAKRKAAKLGKYKRSSKSNVKGTGSRNLKHWLDQDWRQVANPSKKCGEK